MKITDMGVQPFVKKNLEDLEGTRGSSLFTKSVFDVILQNATRIFSSISVHVYKPVKNCLLVKRRKCTIKYAQFGPAVIHSMHEQVQPSKYIVHSRNKYEQA